MSRIEELEQQLNGDLARQDWVGLTKTSEELLGEYIKKLETVFTVRNTNLPIIIAAMRIHLKGLEGINSSATIIAEMLGNMIEYTTVVVEVPE